MVARAIAFLEMESEVSRSLWTMSAIGSHSMYTRDLVSLTSFSPDYLMWISTDWGYQDRRKREHNDMPLVLNDRLRHPVNIRLKDVIVRSMRP